MAGIPRRQISFQEETKCDTIRLRFGHCRRREKKASPAASNKAYNNISTSGTWNNRRRTTVVHDPCRRTRR